MMNNELENRQVLIVEDDFSEKHVEIERLLECYEIIEKWSSRREEKVVVLRK